MFIFVCFCSFTGDFSWTCAGVCNLLSCKNNKSVVGNRAMKGAMMRNENP